MIEMKNVCFSYGEHEILRNFNLTVRNGQCVCLKSPSGGGKTTVFRLITGLETPQSGEITAPKRLAVVFQEDRLIEGLSLKRNVLLPLDKSSYGYAVELLKKFGLGEFLNTPVKNLSGGMKRRAAIVRALSFGGDALLLDEPFNGIDSENKKIIADTIHTDVLDKGIPVLLSTHIPADADLLGAKTVEL